MITVGMNILYVLTLLSPVMVVIYIFRNRAPEYFGNLIAGFSLIIWAGISAAQLNAMLEGIELILSGKVVSEIDKTSPELWSWLTKYINVWLYIFPGVCAAIGANLLSNCIVMKKSKE